MQLCEGPERAMRRGMKAGVCKSHVHAGAGVRTERYQLPDTSVRSDASHANTTFASEKHSHTSQSSLT